ncbi:hypothetical protein L1987_41697 [Smallanthus sonchifolius]|uniref:Uncharacterized protein n=1 Tax=Smallanthus sonchifolius TaxID=185202 RepID=A0ACB9GW44_9ASTR|nr:hypothetical protein L1987_41697 [Smallanthus sonchifolius]
MVSFSFACPVKDIVKDVRHKSSEVGVKGSEAAAAAVAGGGVTGVASGSGKNGGSGFAPEGDDVGGVGKLVFFGGGDSPEMSYSLEDLLKA